MEEQPLIIFCQKCQQFYNKETEIPDYDFFSDNPIKHAKELADIYHKEGYKEVEAKVRNALWYI